MYKLSHNENIIIKSDGTSFDETSGGGIAQEYIRWRDGWTEELWEMQLQDVPQVIHHPEIIIPARTDGEGVEHPEEIIPAWDEEVITQEYVRVVTGTVEHPPHTPEPADPIVVPKIEVVSMKQARLQLLSMPYNATNLLEIVDSAITGMTKAAQIEWEYSAVVEKNHPLFQEIAIALGFTEEQIDDFFTSANLL